MRRSARDRSIGLPPWALLAFLALAAVPPSEARAGCSAHSVLPREARGAAAFHLELLGPVEPRPASPGEVPRPCGGAFCPGNPAVPSSAVPSLETPGDDPWALRVPTVVPRAPGSCASPRANGSARPVDRRGEVFHPPRPRPRGATP